MRYINREYGIEGRPPFFQYFFEERTDFLTKQEISYLNRPVVGFGLDAKVENGGLLAGTLGSVWGIKFSYQKRKRWVEDEDFMRERGRYLAGDINHKFRYLCHGDLTVSMVRYSKDSLVFAFSALHKTKLRLTFYNALSHPYILQLEGNRILGKAEKRGMIKGEIGLTDTDTIFRDRYEVLDNSIMEEMVAQIVMGEGGRYYEGKDKTIIYEATLDAKDSRVIAYIKVGADVHNSILPSGSELNRGISSAELAYSANKIVGSGNLCGNASSIISACSAFKIYNPLRQKNYYIEKRERVNKHYAFDPTEMAVGGLVSALIGDFNPDQLAVYAGDIIMGGVAVWVAFCRTRNRDFLRKAYGRLELRWTLDTNLIEVDPFTRREIGYKMPLSILKETDEGRAMYSLELNTYKLITLEIMEKAARVLGKPESPQIKKLYNEFKDKYKKTFFNEKLGLFMDRYTQGGFHRHYGVTSLLPLVSGAFDDNDMLDKLLINLVDKEKFWNSAPFPTLSIDDYSYGRKQQLLGGDKAVAYENYTGSSLPYLNFLVYLGLVRLGVNDISSRLATTLNKVWKNYFDIYGGVPNITLPNFELDRNSPESSLSGNLNGIIGMLEIIDVEYFREDLRPSLRFGTFAEGEHRLSNVDIFGRKMSISISRRATTLIVDDRRVIEGLGGVFVVRGFCENYDGLEFMIFAKDSITLSINTPIFIKAEKPASYHFNVPKGKFKVIISKSEVKVARIV